MGRGDGAAGAPESKDTATTEPPATDWVALDEQYAHYLDAHPAPPGGSLLAQTILTGPVRRGLLALVEVPPNAEVLDLGTGFGPMAFELAHLHPVRALGVDTDPEVLEVASGFAAALADWLAPGASVAFRAGDAGALPLADASFDVATARLLFQHLAEPRRVVAELWRVLRPGATAFVFDVDDGLSITYPPPSAALQALEAAFSASQSTHGDREVGRKLSTYFAEAGFAIRSVRLLGQARHVASEQGDASRLVNAARLRHVRDEIVSAGLLGAEEFDRLLADYERESAVARFRAESQLVLVAERP